MERKNKLPLFSGLVWLLLTVSFITDTAAQQYTQQDYQSNFQETAHSAAGINSFNATTLHNRPMESRARERAGLFVELYNAYVSRAYYSLLSEAEKADQRLLEEYNNLLKASRNRPDREKYTQELELAKLTYEAHWKMLEGLKSWNAFSAYGSEDLDLFKKEQIKNAYLMFSKGSSDSEIIDFLLYRLADLYYLDE